MVYHKCNIKKENYGFSIIEIIVVLGIFAIFFAMSDSIYTSFKSSSNLKIATSSLVEGLRYAKTNSQVARNDSKWGVKIISGSLVIFKGNDYLSRDQSFGQTFNFPVGVTSNGLDEVVFEKMTGFTNNGGVINLINDSGDKNISINEKGTITY